MQLNEIWKMRGILLSLGLPKLPGRAHTIKESRDWGLMLQREYPKRYKIKMFLENIDQKIYWSLQRIKSAYWSLQHRFNPKYIYTTIKLKRIEPGYHDTDTLIFYAMFEIFEKFMKEQLTDPIVTWEYNEECFSEWEVKENPDHVKEEIKSRNDLWKEMNEIYEWWVNIYPNREDTLQELPTLPKEWGGLSVLNEDFDDEEIMKEWRRIAHTHHEKEVEWEKEDIEMMIRLSKIHNYLWD